MKALLTCLYAGHCMEHVRCINFRPIEYSLNTLTRETQTEPIERKLYETYQAASFDDIEHIQK